ncbi:MAG TPA: hypothetical protein VIA81_05650 [Acidimicrobiia bacterium]|jgi:hypothetical protein
MTTLETQPRVKMVERTGVARRRLLAIVGILAIVVGVGSLAGGVVGAVYTWNQAEAENITTPDDAIFPEVPVRGPLSMYAQADIITHHQLDSTGGLRYAEMPRQVPQVDDAGNPVLDENGEPVMVANAARASWINATTLTTALSLGLMAYALSAFAGVVGITLIASGITFLSIRKALIA